MSATSLIFRLFFMLSLPIWCACRQPDTTMPPKTPITEYKALLSHDGDQVYIKGTFIKYNAMPQFGEVNAVYRPRMTAAKDMPAKLDAKIEVQPS